MKELIHWMQRRYMIAPWQAVEIVNMIEDGTISRPTAKELLDIVCEANERLVRNAAKRYKNDWVYPSN